VEEGDLPARSDAQAKAGKGGEKQQRTTRKRASSSLLPLPLPLPLLSLRPWNTNLADQSAATAGRREGGARFIGSAALIK
jgi:hypothetical protein